MSRRRLLLVVVLLAGAAAFVALDLGRYLSLEYFKSQQAAIEAWRAAQPIKAALLFFVAYVAVTGLSLPGAAVMTLVGGAVFGLFWGLLLLGGLLRAAFGGGHLARAQALQAELSGDGYGYGYGSGYGFGSGDGSGYGYGFGESYIFCDRAVTTDQSWIKWQK
jgi:uncharacterized membrane protein YgcG